MSGVRPPPPEAFQRARTFNTADVASGGLAFAIAVLSEPPVNVPGTETRYSNAGFSIAALMAERATHKLWQQLVTELVGACRCASLAGSNGQFYALAALQPDRDRAVAFLTNDGGDDAEAQASEIPESAALRPVIHGWFVTENLLSR